MGAGKSTLGPEVARRLGRPFVDVDDEVARTHGPIWNLFREQGEAAFREIEARFVRDVAARREPRVIAVGGGAVETQRLLDELDVFVVYLHVDLDTAWRRVQGSRRPLADDKEEFRRRYEARRPLYEHAAHAVADDVDDVVLAAAGVRVAVGTLELLGARLVSTHEVPAGEGAKSADVARRLWSELRLPRDGTLVALGGGCVTDVAGFVAATYLRGIAWAAVPTTIVGQVDAAIGGKTAIDLPEGKNLVGSFHWPRTTIVDPALLETLPARERREGMAEVVKTGLLAAEPLWEAPQPELVRRTAAFKAAVCLRDPYDRGERAILNLGHTFAHALEAAAAYEEVTHGSAVALGLLAALRLSQRPTNAVEEILRPQPVRVDRARAWAALQRDKKRGLVLLGDDGPRWNVELPDDVVRTALDELIAT